MAAIGLTSVIRRAFVTLAIFAAGFCIVGSQIASNALTATFYLTAIRSTGVGRALGIGRIGSIIGSLIGGAAACPATCDTQPLFALDAIPAPDRRRRSAFASPLRDGAEHSRPPQRQPLVAGARSCSRPSRC